MDGASVAVGFVVGVVLTLVMGFLVIESISLQGEGKE